MIILNPYPDVHVPLAHPNCVVRDETKNTSDDIQYDVEECSVHNNTEKINWSRQGKILCARTDKVT